MEQKIYLAPLQGFTDFVYRRAWNKVFEGIDAYFIPYISVKNKEILPKYQREILPDNNPQACVVPQALIKNSDELLAIAKQVEELGYTTLNINAGCPYPMVTRKGRGAGLLPKPDAFRKILNAFFEQCKLQLSVKLRAGLLAPDEIEAILPVLNDFPLSEIIVHPRVAQQLYKGEIRAETFSYVQKCAKHRVVYNGDVFSIADFEARKKQFPNCNYWMLGRGILMNPFLPARIKGIQFSVEQKRNKLSEFHQLVFEDYLLQMDNEGNALNKMQQFWIYFSHNFPQQRKVLKAVKKARTIGKYNAELVTIFADL